MTNKKNTPGRRGQFKREHGIKINDNYSTIRGDVAAMRKIGTLKNMLLSGAITCAGEERRHLDDFFSASNEMDQLLLTEYPTAPAEKAAFLRELNRLAVVCSQEADEILAAIKLGLIRIGEGRK